jgi:hypothetical protein
MVPLHDRKISGWDVLVNKVADKLSNWSDSLLFWREGGLTLLNSVLSIVPLYMISLYKVLMFVKKRLDSMRCRFFCQGSSHRRKYALIS